MVVQGRESLLPQFLRHFGCAFSAARVNDGGPLYISENVKQFRFFVLRFAHHIIEVAAGKTHAKHALLSFAEVQLCADVVNHRRSGRGRQRQHGNLWQELAYLGNL